MSRQTSGSTNAFRDSALAFMPIPAGILLVFATLAAGKDLPRFGVQSWPLSDAVPIYAAEIPFLLLGAFLVWRANRLRSRAYWIGLAVWFVLNAALYFFIGTIHP